MKLLKKIGIILGIVFVGIQFIPTNQNLSTEVSASDFMVIYEVPKTIETKLKVSCYDCHSNNTYYPWYNKIQPIAWFLEGHIDEAKEELDFSEFGNYSTRKKKSKLKSIISQIKDDDMPLTSYTLMHAGAKISEAERKEIMEWMTQLRDGL
ncbi:MAG: heme-binding domain-containing protein [Flavobacteriaceae bacterium]